MLTYFLLSRKALTPRTSLDVVAVVADDSIPALYAREIVALLVRFIGPWQICGTGLPTVQI